MSIVLGSVALVTAVAFWQNRLGYSGLAVVGGTGLAALMGVLALPDRAWTRIVGTDTLGFELGELHAEGAILRSKLPWEPDAALNEFPAWAERVDEWFGRVQDRLAGTQWLGTLLSPVGGYRTTSGGYAKASRYRNALDDKLERLSQIVIALGACQVG